jgi:DNA-binding transcriptional LysR family regulator
VLRGELDCAFVLSDAEQDEGLRQQRLTPVELAVILPPQLGGQQQALSLEQLVAMPWVGTPPSCLLRTHMDSLFASAGREVRPGRTADHESAMRSMVASGMGAGLVRLDQALQAERAGEAVIWNGWRSRTWLCFIEPAAAAESSAVQAVREAVLESWA